MDITVRKHDESRHTVLYIIEQRDMPIGIVGYSRVDEGGWRWCFNIAKTGLSSLRSGNASSYEEALEDFKREYARELEMVGNLNFRSIWSSTHDRH